MSRAYRIRKALSGSGYGSVISYVKALIPTSFVGGFALLIIYTYHKHYLPASIILFFADNWIGLLIFLVAFIIVGSNTMARYYGSLADWDEETEQTIKGKIINIRIWVISWLCWSFYCAYLVNYQIPLDMFLFILITAFAILPGTILSLITYDLKLKEVIQNEKNKAESEKSGRPYTPFTLETNIKDYSGTYGLICIPAYFIFIVVLTLLHIR